MTMVKAFVSWYWRQTVRVRFLLWWLPMLLAAFAADTFRWRLFSADYPYADLVPFAIWLGLWGWAEHVHGKRPRPEYDPSINPRP